MASADSPNPSGAVPDGMDNYLATIRSAAADPEEPERLYQASRRAGASIGDGEGEQGL